MARKIIDIGIVGNDGTGDSIRDSFRKVNDNFRELYGALGLGEKLSFLELDETPNSYAGEENAILSVNENTDGLRFKQLTGGEGIAINFDDENQIEIINTAASVSADRNPRLGGNLRARSAGETQYRILDLPVYAGTTGGPTTSGEAVSKSYADSKVAVGGVNSIDPATGEANAAFGRMTGPLILSRDPQPADDLEYEGLIAATKRYVDNAGFGSVINLYVATSGQDARIGVGSELQGRALPYAFRSIEAALKRAEEIVRAAPPEIGPYRKVLTWTDPLTLAINNCFLNGQPGASPESGTGFEGRPLMSIDNIELADGGFFYRVNDILFIDPPTVVEGVTQPASIRVLTINTAPGGSNGPILTFEFLTGGVFIDLPGSDDVPVTSSTSINGINAKFNVNYKVAGVEIQNKGGSLADPTFEDYSLVSVRVTPQEGDTGTGAFGFADVVNGQIDAITITDGGTGFKLLPVLNVDLPRFRIYTGGQRTDFTGDVTTETVAAKKGRDIREGLYLRGETSGALAQILAHRGDLDSEGNELFDVDIKYGTFLPGEEISYGDVANTVQITVLIESGIYEENFPLKVSQNVSIVGDEFRRVVVRPKPGPSSSPWAFQYFRRDKFIDGINTAKNSQNALREDLFGYHYLADADQPVYPLVNNKGFYRGAATLLELNKTFLQEEVIAWVNQQVSSNISPFPSSFIYNQNLWRRDFGSLIDAMSFDLRYGGGDRTVSTALKYRDNASGLIAITDQLSQTSAAIEKLDALIQQVIRNRPVSGLSSELQIIDLAYTAESGTYGVPVGIINISRASTAAVTTSAPHGFLSGELVNFENVGGMENLNGNSFYVKTVNSTQFELYLNKTLVTPVNSEAFSPYTTGGSATPTGGVVGALTNAILDVISNSGAVNYPLDNDQIDVFLMNDATIIRAMTIQGAGGFAMVLDPEGQILAKSPYAQEGAVFSKSTGRKTFAGGQFVDGFTGNLKFKILALPNRDPITGNSIRVSVGELKRFPQLPASFIVDDTVYRINYVRDFTFNTAGSTATLVLDETTPWPFDIFTYNESICRRDVGLILNGLGYDIVFGSNYHTRKAALSYRQANAAVVINDQLSLTVRAIDYAHDILDEILSGLTPASNYLVSRGVVDSSKTIISNIIRRGQVAAPNLILPDPPGLASELSNAKELLLDNLDFIKDETIAYLQTTYPSLVFESARCRRDLEYIVHSVCYDLIYGGNSQSRDAGLKYFDGVGSAITQQIPEDQKSETIDGISHAKLIAQAVIENIDFSTVGTLYSSTPQVFDLSNPSDSATAAVVGGLFEIVTGILAGGATPAEILPNLSSYSYNSDRITARSTINSNITDVQDEVIAFINSSANVYEILMPGNRSMLSNDFTQICDLGYGLITTNGGLAEAVSMFTYYNQISYYSINGGQIRSIAGSSAHGVYALVAEGADPLEVPTPVDSYFDFSQGAIVYNDGGVYDNRTGGLILYVGEYEYPPLDFCEIEVDHGGVIGLVRYPISSATTEEAFPEISGKPIYRLNITSDEGGAGTNTNGLAAEILDGAPITIRVNTQLVLTGDVVGVATRPSTALVLNETNKNIYRVLEFVNYVPAEEETQVCTFTTGTETIINTASPHNQLPGYIVRFTTSTGGSLPAGLMANENYYILDDGYSETTFKVSTSQTGAPIPTTTAGSGTFFFTPSALARTTLREGYDYVEATIWNRQPYRSYGDNLIVGVSDLVIGRNYTIVSTGITGSITDFTLLGAASNTPGTSFVKNSTSGTGTGTAVPTDTICSFDEPSNTILLTAHGFNNGDAIRFESGGSLPSGIFSTRPYFVFNSYADEFQIVEYPGSEDPIDFTSSGIGINAVARIIGIQGDSSFAIVPVGTNDRPRVVGMKFNFKGNNYTVTQYDNESATGEQFGRIYITPPLLDSVVGYNSPITLKLAVPARTEGSQGTLTIRISLTRVTGHDFLEIGTGSYADTNYPNEIYGPPVRIATETLLDTSGEQDFAQIVERNSGRCFFVTTDQFGNFSVGPFFRVDQGTGKVTFAAAIALSNLDGIGFKRGVPIAEFSTDTSFSDNATDTVPTENAVRNYVDRRLGVDHDGFSVPDERIIPPSTGGFLPLNGQNPMKGNLNMDVDYRIVNLADPVDPQDGVNLRSVRISNLQDFNFAAVESGSIFAFTGNATDAYPAKLDGDIFVPEDGVTTGVDSTLNKLNIYIKPEIIDNDNINPAAEISQSKLDMNFANTFNEDDPVSGWAGSATKVQADLGLSKFSDENFDTLDGYVRIKNKGIVFSELQDIGRDTVVGYGEENTDPSTGVPKAIPYSTVVDRGFSIKKNQYSSVGFLRRIGATNTRDDDYTVVEATSGYSGSTDPLSNNRLVIRSGTGTFGGSTITATVQYNIGTVRSISQTTSATGGSTVYSGFLGNAGLAIGDGTNDTDKVNTHYAQNHIFRNQANTANGTITAGTIAAATFTTGNAGTAGNLTGNLFLTTTSNLTLGTGTLDTQNGTLLSRTLTTGAASTTGTITGDWSLASGSKINAPSGTTLQSRTLTTGNSTTSGSLTGLWSLTAGSKIDFTSGTLQSTTLSTGSDLTAGTVTGSWTVNSGSTFVATSVVNQQNSATIAASSTNTASNIVRRDASGNFAAGTITATLSGTATNADNVDIISTNTSSSTFYPTFVSSTSGYNGVRVDSGLGYIPSSNTMIAGTFSGDVNASTVTTLALTSGSSSTSGSVTGRWSLTSGSRFEATYADLAEYYEGDQNYEVGTVLIFGGDKEVTISEKESDTRVAGVVSDTAAYTMNLECQGIRVCVALQGRVPVKVVGKISKGDILVTSNIKGVAIASKGNLQVGTMIGKALENYDSDHIGMIQVAVGRT